MIVAEYESSAQIIRVLKKNVRVLVKDLTDAIVCKKMKPQEKDKVSLCNTNWNVFEVKSPLCGRMTSGTNNCTSVMKCALPHANCR
jgi:hypothetical protein